MKHVNWGLLQVFNLYRVTLAAALGLQHYFTKEQSLFTLYSKDTLLTAITLYACFSLLALCFSLKRSFTFNQQLSLSFPVDVISLIMIMHLSGGINSGLGFLLIITAAAAGILLSSRFGLLLAAFASLAVLAETAFQQYYGTWLPAQYTQAGTLGAALFFISFFLHIFTKHLRRTEDLVDLHQQAYAQMHDLNAHIIDQIQSGILFLNEKDEVQFINAAGKKLLALSGLKNQLPLENISPTLARAVKNWHIKPEHKLLEFSATEESPKVLSEFSSIGEGDVKGTLITMQDLSKEQAQVQQLKIASLGHLAANVAHEIRNPLSAVSHAAQLLEEQIDPNTGMVRLVEIIQTHSVRMNRIIENVMCLSRRDHTSRELINWADWIEQFKEHYAAAHIEDHIIHTQHDTQVQFYFDSSQLEQILTNLCDNSLRHTYHHTGTAEVTLRCHAHEHHIHLQIIDQGGGIPTHHLKYIFDPFYTTEAQGSGLGLYIAKDLCESNHSTLSIKTDERGTCFTLQIPHPEAKR